MSTPLKIATVCTGIGSPDLAADRLGWEHVFMSEVDPHASTVLAHRFPGVPNLGDMTKIDGRDYRGKIDILVGGTPCFSADTLIVTSNGLAPIADIKPGDLVLTHEQRWKPVLRVGSKEAETFIVKGQGASYGICTTRNHRFYSTKKNRSWIPGGSGYSTTLSNPEWISAENMPGRFWGIPAAIKELPIPPIASMGNEKPFPALTPEIMMIVGRWVGDGWTRIDDRRGYVIIADGIADSAGLRADLDASGIKYCEIPQGAIVRFQISSRPFARWLRDNFGTGAKNKSLPAWLLGSPLEMRKAFLSGYLAADGCKKKNGYAFSTVSKKLAIGGVMLAASLGYGVSCGFYKPKNGKTSQIDGRMIVNNGGYICSIYDRPRSAVISNDIHWGRVKSCEPTNLVQTVYDLEVEGDHSYVADGVIVHNCQGFSIAGKRGGLDDPRSGLAIKFVELLAEIRPTWFVWENVPGVFSSEGGRDFASFLGCLTGRRIDVPSRGKAASGRNTKKGWKNSGILEGIPSAYSVAWRTLDAQYFGVPQRRRRVFVVGHLGDWRPPAAVLFERESLRWNNPPSRRTEQAHHAGAIGRTALPIHDKATRYQGGGDTRNGDGSGNGLGIGKVGDPSPTLTSGDRHAVFQQNTRDEVRWIGGDGQIAGALAAEPGMKQQNYVVAFSSKDYGADATIDLSPTLRSGEFDKSWANDGTPPAIAFMAGDSMKGSSTMNQSIEVAPTLKAGQSGNRPAIAFPAEMSGTQYASSLEVSPALSVKHTITVAKSPVIRRLTPIECERLQGFPDNWTQVQHKGKPMADGPRYKMCGNSIAVPVIEWIFDRLNQVHQQIEHQ